MASDDQRAMPSRSLAEVAGDIAAGQATPQELHDAFLNAQVITPGRGFPEGPFTSEVELARARGPVRWFATTGADLFGLVPQGYDLILDIAGPAPLRISPSAVQRSTAAEVDWRR